VYSQNLRLVKTRSHVNSLTLAPKCQVSDAEPGEDQVSYRFTKLSYSLSVRFRMLSLVKTRSRIDSLTLVSL
jgi:hypothetical protein